MWNESREAELPDWRSQAPLGTREKRAKPMNRPNTYSTARRYLAIALLLFCAIAPALAQPPGSDTDSGPSAAPVTTAAPGATEGTPVAPPAAQQKGPPPIEFLELLIKGGAFMWPILAMSLLAATMVVERAINLRRGRVIPAGLMAALGQLGSSSGGFDPRKAYRICQQYPSVAATVIRAMLLKIGRPHSEVEHAVAETCQREAERLYANVRWLNLAVAV